MKYEQLKLENQVCFPVYTASRLIIREYQPLLDKLGITYTQYLVLMVLWEKDGIPVNDIANKLVLNTNTLTPLLKRMEGQGILQRKRDSKDERRVIVKLTSKGTKMMEEASEIPGKLAEGLNTGSMDILEVIEMRDKLNRLIDSMIAKKLESVQ
jgi:DNA-binding MarR family transcriptional regulator